MNRLPRLYGGIEVLDEARRVLPPIADLNSALSDLELLARDNHFTVSIDLGDLRGYQYHSGVVFSAYSGDASLAGSAAALALGGRYDDVGQAFGRARAATGFSIDLRDLAHVVPMAEQASPIRAPYGDDPGLLAAIEALKIGRAHV